jgi:hypothetical protein
LSENSTTSSVAASAVSASSVATASAAAPTNSPQFKHDLFAFSGTLSSCSLNHFNPSSFVSMITQFLIKYDTVVYWRSWTIMLDMLLELQKVEKQCSTQATRTSSKSAATDFYRQRPSLIDSTKPSYCLTMISPSQAPVSSRSALTMARINKRNSQRSLLQLDVRLTVSAHSGTSQSDAVDRKSKRSTSSTIAPNAPAASTATTTSTTTDSASATTKKSAARDSARRKSKSATADALFSLLVESLDRFSSIPLVLLQLVDLIGMMLSDSTTTLRQPRYCNKVVVVVVVVSVVLLFFFFF